MGWEEEKPHKKSSRHDRSERNDGWWEEEKPHRKSGRHKESNDDWWEEERPSRKGRHKDADKSEGVKWKAKGSEADDSYYEDKSRRRRDKGDDDSGGYWRPKR